ncbi:hypothetical protein [Comamonas testosteroni]|uniref:hypothetical protein n=1 Tax=Comamonas testosteroni TaxID=285 RepID=UPI0005B45EAF|nr:hypothetical protein [Comamonas testosteroni]
MSKFDEIAELLSATEKTHISMTRMLLHNAYSADINKVIRALQFDCDSLRLSVDQYITGKSWHPIPLMMLVMSGTVVILTAYLLVSGKLPATTGLLTLALAFVSCIPVFRTNINMWREAQMHRLLFPGLECQSENNNSTEIQKLTEKFRDEIAALRMNSDVKTWTMKDYLILWMKSEYEEEHVERSA